MTTYHVDPDFVHSIDDVRAFPLEDGDFIVSGFPKSGTNWIQIIVSNLWDDWTTTRNEYRRVPNLSGRDDVGDGYQGHSACVTVGSPRLMKTHLPRNLMPARWPDHGKVLHITRNPKDVIVSYYYQLLNSTVARPDSVYAINDFTEHLQRFIRGGVPYGPYLDNVLSWRTFEHPSLLKVTYEDVKADSRGFVQTLVDFVGKPVSDERIDKVLAETDFAAMRSGDIHRQINHPEIKSGTPFMRKGVVGDWTTMLSVEQSRIVDEALVRPLEEAGARLTYE